MARFLLNSAVITAPGRYDYRLVSPKEARTWFRVGPVVSTIGYQETADALAVLLESPVAVDRRTIRMADGDEALVFRLALPPGTPRIAPGDKGALGQAVLAGHFELGLLVRLKDHPAEAAYLAVPEEGRSRAAVVAARTEAARAAQESGQSRLLS